MFMVKSLWFSVQGLGFRVGVWGLGVGDLRFSACSATLNPKPRTLDPNP